MVAMRSGAKARDIAAHLGICRERVYSLNLRATLDWQHNKKSPVEMFLRESPLRPKAKARKAIERLASGRDWLNV
jgi:hypothetical protein